MKKTHLFAGLILLGFFSFSSCGRDAMEPDITEGITTRGDIEEPPPVDPIPEDPYFDITPVCIEAPMEGIQNFLLYISTNGDWSLMEHEASQDENLPDIYFSQTYGSGSAEIRVDIGPNRTGESIDVYYTFTSSFENEWIDIDVRVIQKDFYEFKITPQVIDVPAAGGVYTLFVESNTDWRISEESAGGDVTFDKRSGSGDGTITVTVGPNATGQFLNWACDFEYGPENSRETFGIRQGRHYFTLSPDSFSVPAEGGKYDLSVFSNVAWRVIGVPMYPHVTVNQYNGTGDGRVEITIAPVSDEEEVEDGEGEPEERGIFSRNNGGIDTWIAFEYHIGNVIKYDTVFMHQTRDYFRISPAKITAPWRGLTNYPIAINTNVAWAINDYAVDVNPKRGTGPGTVYINVPPNLYPGNPQYGFKVEYMLGGVMKETWVDILQESGAGN